MGYNIGVKTKNGSKDLGIGAEVCAIHGYSSTEEAFVPITVSSSGSIVSGGNLDETVLNAVTANGASDAIETDGYNKFTFHIIATSVTSGADVSIQSSLDNINWVTINYSTASITSSGITEDTFSDVKYKYMRAVVSNYVDGTYTVLLFGGN